MKTLKKIKDKHDIARRAPKADENVYYCAYYRFATTLSIDLFEKLNPVIAIDSLFTSIEQLTAYK